LLVLILFIYVEQMILNSFVVILIGFKT